MTKIDINVILKRIGDLEKQVKELKNAMVVSFVKRLSIDRRLKKLEVNHKRLTS